MFRVVRVVMGKGVNPWLVAELAGHIALSFLPMALPIAILFAAIYTMNRFSEDSEIVAMRSFGISRHRLFAPFAIVALCIAIIIYGLGISIIPQSRAQFRNTLIILSSQGMLSDVRPEQFYMEIPGVILFAETVEDGGENFGDVFIYFDDSRGREDQVITAKKGTLIKQFPADSPGFAAPNLRMHLFDGSITKAVRGEDNLEVIHFKEYDFPITTDFLRPSTIARDSMRSNKELRELIAERVQRLNALQDRINEGRTLNRRQEIEKGHLLKDIPSSKIEYWSRFNVPILCFVFALLGFSLGVKQGRGRSKNTAAVSILVVILYYALYFGGLSLTQRGDFPPEVTSFGPTLLALLIALYYYRKVEWPS